MIEAYVLVQANVGQAQVVAERIRQIVQVSHADEVTGPYDVIVRITGESIDELGGIVLTQIQQISGITRTITCPIVTSE